MEEDKTSILTTSSTPSSTHPLIQYLPSARSSAAKPPGPGANQSLSCMSKIKKTGVIPLVTVTTLTFPSTNYT
jgi:hypothetical protein